VYSPQSSLTYSDGGGGGDGCGGGSVCGGGGGGGGGDSGGSGGGGGGSGGGGWEGERDRKSKWDERNEHRTSWNVSTFATAAKATMIEETHAVLRPDPAMAPDRISKNRGSAKAASAADDVSCSRRSIMNSCTLPSYGRRLEKTRYWRTF
jgi:hypothetical protein